MKAARIIRLVALLSVSTLEACTTPTLPSDSGPTNAGTSANRFDPTYTGTWIGSHQIVSCGGFLDFRPCSYLRGSKGHVSLTLDDSAAIVTGTLEIDAPSANSTYAILYPYKFAVRGWVDPSGELTLSGSLDLGMTIYGDQRCGPASLSLTSWKSHQTGDGMQGHIELSTFGFPTGCSNPQSVKLSSDLVDVKLSR